MSKSKSWVTDCENCALCEQVFDFHINNDVRALLDKVQWWDNVQKIFNNGKSRYKNIDDFNCLMCSFKTDVFIDWKEHILSMSHMAESHRIKNLYSYICTFDKCKVLLYGTKESIHITCKHIKSVNSKILPTLMAEVMRRYLNKLSPLYFCYYCKQFDKKPINHQNQKCLKKKKNSVDYYCKFCRVRFFSSPEMIDFHSLSVEHMTLKCFSELCSTAKKSTKRIKLSEEPNQYEENNCPPSVKNEYTTNSIKVSKNNTDQSNEDETYGEYVKQRLKNIKNETVKQNIKLEIDYLFYANSK